MKKVVNALGNSLPDGNKFFTADVKEGQYTVTVFLHKPPDMERVKREVAGANNTATVTYTCHQGQRDVTVTWVEPDTFNDEAIALQKKENACGRGGAGRGGGRGGAGHGAGANGRGGVGGGAVRCGHGIWTTEERAMYEQLEADYKFAMQLQADDKGRGGASRGGRGGAGRGGGRGSTGRGGGGGVGSGRGVGMGINPADMLSDSDVERWLAEGGGGHVDVGAGCGDHGAISALQQARNMWQEQTYAEFACAGGHGGAGADGHTNEMTDAQFAEWLAKGGASADGHHGVYPTTVEELRKMDL